MKFCFYTNSISPHQLPLARELVKRLGADNYRYVYTTPLTEERKKCGWDVENESWLIKAEYGDGVADEMLESCNILLSGMRELDLFEKRAARGLKTLYVSERWFKPLKICPWVSWRIPGWMRLVDSRYWCMAKRMIRLLVSGAVKYLPTGIFAERDMDFLVRILAREKNYHKLMWGYFVSPSQVWEDHVFNSAEPLKVLWVGRMVDWKRVDTIIRAVRKVEKGGRGGRQTVLLTLVGDGPEKPRLQALANRLIGQSGNQMITFLSFRPIAKIRELMRDHDVYVLASNQEEGWGAALNEALEEGMRVIGTYEAGSSATILSEGSLYHAGKLNQLAELLAKCVQDKKIGVLCGQGIGAWSAAKAAERLLAL